MDHRLDAADGAAGLLRAAADLPDDAARAEIDRWVAGRGGPAEALVEALPEVDDTARALGFRALLRIGAGAADAVGTLAGHDELDPWVAVWRVDAAVADAAEVDCAGDPERFVRLLGAVLGLWGPQAVTGWVAPVAGKARPAVMTGSAWRVRRPETETVLAAIGSLHPDETVSRAARKALFKHRSSRGS
ncbi:MAG TPA: hypothetical protein VE575_11915 [Acidimicrobiales bacterium]|nr:hypothetical protein [Acidimicrobiales bacterium]